MGKRRNSADDDFGEHLHEVRSHRRMRHSSPLAEHLAEHAVSRMTGGDEADYGNTDFFEEALGGAYLETDVIDELSFDDPDPASGG